MVLRHLRTAATNVKVTELRFINLSLTYSCDSVGTNQLKSVKLRSATYTILHILPGRKRQVSLWSTALRSGVALHINK